MLTYQILFALAKSLHDVKKQGSLSESLKHQWRNESTIIKKVTDDEKFSLLSECMESNAEIIELGSDQDPINYGNFIIVFPINHYTFFNIEIVS